VKGYIMNKKGTIKIEDLMIFSLRGEKMNDIPKKIFYALICVAMISSLGAIKTSASSLSEPEAKTILVSTTGADVSGCGIGTALPCRSIQYAVTSAATGDTILVAKGTYTYSENDPCKAVVTRSVVCWWDKQLTINGGYSEANWTVADPVNNLTIIDGGSQYRGVTILRMSGTASLNMQGFTIQNGRAVGSPVGNTYAGHAFGAGIWASKSFVNLKNMVFKNNIAMGGSSGSYTTGGWAFGGGLALEGPAYGGNSTLENISFTGNQAGGGSGSDGGGNALGGALFSSEAAVTAKELTFTNNLAKGGNTSGSGCSGSGPGGGYGGAAALQNHSSLNLSFITTTGNQALGANGTGCAGAGIGGGFFLEGATASISDALFQANQAVGGVAKKGGIGWAGGVYTEKVNLTLDRVRFIGNIAASGGSNGGGAAGAAGGGAAYMAEWDGNTYYTTIMNCLFAENKAVMGTPGTYGTGGGGGIFIQGIAANITHSTFANNQLENGLDVGQGLLVIRSSRPGSANIKYSVFTDHKNNLTYNNSAVQIFGDNPSNPNTGSLSYVWFGNNTSDTNLPSWIPSDHLWRDASNSAGYISPSTPNYDYHLQTTSPVIDLATGSATNVDLDRQLRPVGPRPDLGAYEYSIPTLRAFWPVLNVMTDTSDILSLTDFISVSTGPIAEWNATTSDTWVYLGPSGTSQQTTGQTGSNLTIRIDPSKIALGSYEVTINLTSNTANPTMITIYFYYVDQIETAYLPNISK
jgi:hypothetical protein